MKQKGQKIKIGLSMMVAVTMIMALTLSAQAAVVSREDQPINEIDYNQCTGENVTISGNLHTVDTVTIDKNGGYHLTEHVSVQEASGIGSISGINYNVLGGYNLETNGKVGNESTYAFDIKFVSQGSTDNLQISEVAHTTVHPDGTVTSNFDKVGSVCRG